MDQDRNCKKCRRCHWDELWGEWICDKWQQVVYRGDEALGCKDFKERSEK